MSSEWKVRLAIMVVSAGVMLAAAALSAHGIVHPLDPIGVGPE
jgi:hypothetical protein